MLEVDLTHLYASARDMLFETLVIWSSKDVSGHGQVYLHLLANQHEGTGLIFEINAKWHSIRTGIYLSSPCAEISFQFMVGRRGGGGGGTIVCETGHG